MARYLYREARCLACADCLAQVEGDIAAEHGFTDVGERAFQYDVVGHAAERLVRKADGPVRMTALQDEHGVGRRGHDGLEHVGRQRTHAPTPKKWSSRDSAFARAAFEYLATSAWIEPSLRPAAGFTAIAMIA